MATSWPATISITPLWAQTPERRCSSELHTSLGRRSSDLDHYLDPSLEPRKSTGSGGRSFHGPQPQAPSPDWGPHFQPLGRPTGGVAGADSGSWVRWIGGDVNFAAAPEGTPYQCLPASHTKAPHLPARAGSKRRRTSRLAGGCERASVRVCVCPCLCVTGAVRSSVRLRVRGRPSVGLSAEPSVPLSLLVPCPIAPPNAPGLQSRGYSCRVCWAPPARAPPRPRTGLRRSPGIAQGSPARRGGGGELRHRLGL